MGIKICGQRICREAIALATQYAFNGLNLNKLTAGMVVDNVGSYRPLSRLVIEVGRLTRHVLLKEGMWTRCWSRSAETGVAGQKAHGNREDYYIEKLTVGSWMFYLFPYF